MLSPSGATKTSSALDRCAISFLLLSSSSTRLLKTPPPTLPPQAARDYSIHLSRQIQTPAGRKVRPSNEKGRPGRRPYLFAEAARFASSQARLHAGVAPRLETVPAPAVAAEPGDGQKGFAVPAPRRAFWAYP